MSGKNITIVLHRLLLHKQHQTSLNSQTTPVGSVSPTTNSSQQARPPRYVNPKRDKLDPNRRVLGNSFDHRWVEKTDTIDIDVRLPKGVKNKNQLNVVVK